MEKEDLKAIETVLALGYLIGNSHKTLYQPPTDDTYEVQDRNYTVKTYKSLRNAIKELEKE